MSGIYEYVRISDPIYGECRTMFNSRYVFFLYSNSTVLEVRSEVPYLFAKITWTFFAIYCIKNHNIGNIWWSIIYFRFWFLKTVKVLFEKDKFDILILSQSLYLLKSLVQIFFVQYKYQVILIRSLNWRVVEAPQLCNLTVLPITVDTVRANLFWI